MERADIKRCIKHFLDSNYASDNHSKCAEKLLSEYEQKIREEAIAEIHSEMSYELAQLEVAGLSETTLRTFAYRIKAITENLLDKLKEKNDN